MKGSTPLSFSFISLFIFGAVFSVPTSMHVCRPEQRDALLEFKNEIKIGECSSINGIDSHPKTESWKNNSDCCSWEGIKCNAELGEVIKLNLSSSCLCGQFRSNSSFFVLQNLHFLTTLDLSLNILTGFIPSSIGNLSRLTNLKLSSNQFTGQIPFSIGNLSHLSNLIISNNKIEGQVSSWLWTLPNLLYLDLSNNNFIGFERSSKHDKSSIRSPSMMKYLFGSNNNFTENIPSFICSLRSLITLDLSRNNLNGSIPSCMRNLKSTLSDLNLRHNRLTGRFPKAIFESLRSLDVGHNQLVGKLSISLLRSLSLEVLNVESNKINDTFPFWLNSLKKLQILVLRSNIFHGPIHQVSFPELRIIDISHNHFNGTLSSDFFAKWKAMSSLETNEGYREYSMVLMYKGLEMNFLRILKSFRGIDFSGNKFEGNIPRSIGLLKELRLLNLSKNAFTGHIPSSMGNLTELESLDVSQNLLSGAIPQELGNLSSLAVIDVSHNQLSGELPSGTQISTQPCSSFEDNMRYFGWKYCDNIQPVFKKPPEEEEEEEEEKKEEVISWKAVAIGYGLGIVYYSWSHIVFVFFSFTFKK